MKVIIALSEDKIDYDVLKDAIKSSKFPITELISGKVSPLSVRWAIEEGVEVKTFLPNWKDVDALGAVVKKGKWGYYNTVAGEEANMKMVEYADALIAIWDGESDRIFTLIMAAEAGPLQIYVEEVEK